MLRQRRASLPGAGSAWAGVRGWCCGVLRAAGVFGDSDLISRAVDRALHEMCDLPWVEAILVGDPGRQSTEKGVTFTVIVSGPPGDGIRCQVLRLVAGVNRRYRTHLLVSIVPLEPAEYLPRAQDGR